MRINNETTVSIVMPAYNCSRTVDTTIESVFAQTFRNFAFLIFVDGNDIDSYSVIMQWKSIFLSEGISLTVVLLERQCGASQIRQLASQKINSPFVAFIDSDDVWDKYYLEKQVNKICLMQSLHSCPVLSYGLGISFDERGIRRLLRQAKFASFPEVIWSNGIGAPSGIIFSSKIYELDVGHDAEMRTHEDWEWYIRFLKIGRAHHNPEAVFFYRIHENSVTASNSFEGFSAIFKMANKFSAHISDKSLFDMLALNSSAILFRKNNLLGLKFIIIAIVFGSQRMLNLFRLLFWLTSPFSSWLLGKITKKRLLKILADVSVPQEIDNLRKLFLSL